MTNDQFRRYAAIAGFVAVPLLVPALLHDSLSKSYPWAGCVTVGVAHVVDSERFSVEALLKNDGAPVYAGPRFSKIEGGSFCRDTDAPMSSRGRTQLTDSARVWTVLAGDKGQFYLQNPPLQIRVGEWIAANIQPGRQIAKIMFFEVDAEADQIFSARAERHEWDEFAQLPAGVKELASVTLK
jgi:hypothetical protein